MSSWGTLLALEQQAIAQFAAEGSEAAMTLFTDFRPNAGGQSRFFDAMSLTDASDRSWRWGGLVGGIGSGKSYCGAAWAISRGLIAPRCRGLIAANTFGQLARSSLITLVEVCRQFNVPLEPYRESIEDNALAIANSQRCYIGAEKAFVYVLSMSSFMGKTQAARGLQIRWAWLDEAAFSAEQAFQTLDGRMGRGPGNLKGLGLITTSPNGYNWLYDRFADPNRSEPKQALYTMFSCKTRENVAVLGEDYVQGLEGNYTDELARQELEGEFVNTVKGRVYKYFDRTLHAMSDEDADVLAYEPDLPVHITFDFNFSPSVAVLCQIRDREVHAFAEFFISDVDSFELSTSIADFLLELGHHQPIYIYGDATGRARSAASRLSCWDIVFNTFRSYGFKIHRRFRDANPHVITRVNSVNCLLKSNRCFVDFEACPNLVKDLEMVTWGENGMDKTSDGILTHISDAFGYLIDYLFPYKAIAARPNGQKQLPGLPA